LADHSYEGGPKAALANRAYQAVGVLAGRLEGGEIEVLTGERFPATPSPKLRQWLDKNPDPAQAVRIWLAYPRTTKEPPGLAFFLVGSPEDQDDPRWKKEIDRFNIKGKVVVSRAQMDSTVVWIPRNDAPPVGKRRHPNWKGHTLFLRRAMKPVRKWKGADVWIDAVRSGGELIISMYTGLEHHSTNLELPIGWNVPWPFRPKRSTVTALCNLSRGGVPVTNPRRFDSEVFKDYRPSLRKHLSLFNKVQNMRAVDLLPRQAIYEGQPMEEREIAREAENAQQWGKFFQAFLKYLDSMEIGQLAALSQRCDPEAAIRSHTEAQAAAWFEIERADSCRVWFEGAPVPNRVKKVVLELMGITDNTKAPPKVDQAPEAPATEELPPSSREQTLATAMAYFRTQGCPDSYSSRQTLAWVVQSLKEEGLTDLQITMHGWLPPGLLDELLRVELPHPLDH